MSDNIADEKTKKIAEKKTGAKSKDELRTSIAHFLIDFDVISYLIAFIIALAFNEFLKDLMEFIVLRFIPKRSAYLRLLSSLLSLIFVFIFAFLFVKLIFYKFLYTTDIVKQRQVQKAISKKEEKKVEKEINNEAFLVFSN